jgi:GT2 family glycosyltransferase
MNPTANPSVTVIVLNYNGAPYVGRCLGSLFRNSYPNFEVFFIDNDSPDKSAEIALSLFSSDPRFKMIRNRQNLGFSVGNNIGFNRTKAKYVIVLNNDTEVEETFIKTLVQTAEVDERIGSVGCRIKQVDGRILYGPMFMDYGFVIRAFDPNTYGKHNVVLANCGCATLFRKTLLDKIGGFDSYLWTDWEDHDLGFRINGAGFKCVYTPETTVLHLGGGSYLGMSREREIRITRNKLFFYVKNYQAKNLLLRFSLIFVNDALTKIKYRKSDILFAGIKQFISLIKPLIFERRQIREFRVISDDQIFSNCRTPERVSLWKSLRHV